MLKLIYLMAGGAFGTLLRYLISGYSYKLFGSGFPWGTLSVNLIGSLLIGVTWGLFENSNVSSNIRLYVFVGIFGGFTTFSSYTLECLNLFRDGQVKLALLNIGLSNILGLLLVYIGYVLSSSMIKS